MARVGLDIDGVLAEFSGGFREYASLSGGKDYPEATTWRFFEEWGWTEEEWHERHWAFVADGWYRTLDLIGGTETREALHSLKDAGHEIILVTARKTVPGQRFLIEQDTIDWLDDNDIPYDELHFESDKTKIDVDYFLDDRYENYDVLADTVASFLLDQPWNRVQRIEFDWAYVCKSVAEYVELVLAQDELITSEGEGVSSKEVRVTSETGGQKGRKDAELATVDPLALWELAKVSGFGARKYESFNYLKGYDWSLSYSALQRHLMQFWAGEDRDKESGELHVAHAAWHCLALVSFLLRDLGTDDRPPRMEG